MQSLVLLLVYMVFNITSHSPQKNITHTVIAKGRMPNIARDNNQRIHLVYGTGDSIMYSFSSDGKSFTTPALVAVLPKLFASAMRGPQVAAGTRGIFITAATSNGNIYSYSKDNSGKWTTAKRVNEVNEVAKEALMALGADGLTAYAVWLGSKGAKGQNVYGARSVDGGKTWGKNVLVYASPDSSVCECCKPSIAMAGNNVYVMFRNWLNGSRDLYTIKSTDGGQTFEKAQKLGNGSWKLNGCPMDGGGIVLDNKIVPQTVWRREGKIYGSTDSGPELEIGEGRGCSIESINNKNFYSWSENGNIIVLSPANNRIDLGKGSLPLIKAISDKQLLCVWENDNYIHTALLSL